jgi:hypothetical protein
MDENFSKEIETMKKNQAETLEIKNPINQNLKTQWKASPIH